MSEPMRPRRDNPWYVEAFLAAGGWIAGLLAAAAIFAFVGFLFTNNKEMRAAAATGLAIGLAFVAAGSVLGRAGAGDFRRHFSIAMISAGLTAATVGTWYLVWDLLGGDQPDGGGDATKVAYAGLATATLYLAPAALAARRVKDGILAFLTTSAWFWIVGASLIVLADRQDGPTLPLQVFPAAAALAGLAFFTLARDRLGAAGAALLIAPMLFYEAARNGAGFIGVPSLLHAGPASSAVFAAGAVWCLILLRDRYPLPGLLAATALIAAGIWLLPDAGAIAILILLAGMAAGHRGLTAVGVVALTWFVGKFYYDLSMTLLQKSAILAGLGAATLGGALALRRLQRGAPAAAAPPGARRSLLANIAFGLLLIGALAVVNRSAMKLEADFREARAIFLPLGPVDPRSILQGDYMVLWFRETIYPAVDQIEALPERGEVFLKVDADGVAAFSRIPATDDVPAADEIRLDYVRRGGAMRYCPDSYFFQEGEADLFAAARFAVVKVAPDGKTRLVALADENRKVIEPPRRQASCC
jgi:uncharacterized membrane-anchored protein